MKVSELRTLLEEYDDDLEVVLAKDAEGNEFAKMSEISIGYFISEGSETDFISEDDVDEDDDINLDDADEAIALWPED